MVHFGFGLRNSTDSPGFYNFSLSTAKAIKYQYKFTLIARSQKYYTPLLFIQGHPNEENKVQLGVCNRRKKKKRKKKKVSNDKMRG